MKKWLGKANDGIRSFAEFWSDGASRQAVYDQHLNQAKALSDFIGMIVRFGFANFATGYFYKRAAEVHGLNGWCIGVTATFTLALTIIFGFRLMTVILAYEMRSVAAWKGTWSRLVFALLAILTTASLWYGVVDLVHTLSLNLAK